MTIIVEHRPSIHLLELSIVITKLLINELLLENKRPHYYYKTIRHYAFKRHPIHL